MNREWMREKLERFEALCNAYDRESRRTTDYNELKQEISADMTTREPTVREILRRLDAELAQADLRPLHMTGVHEAQRAIGQALGIVRDQDEWKANLEPDAPSLIADQFHPLIWAGASPRASPACTCQATRRPRPGGHARTASTTSPRAPTPARPRARTSSSSSF
jgi:hypothetical protein